MSIIHVLRLLLTLLALGFAMANPAAAVPAMAASAGDGSASNMPCHEAAAMAAPVEKSVAVPVGLAGGGHLCCVLACLVVPPLSEMVLSHPVARTSVLVPLALHTPSGRMVAMPTPPPRLS